MAFHADDGKGRVELLDSPERVGKNGVLRVRKNVTKAAGLKPGDFAAFRLVDGHIHLVKVNLILIDPEEERRKIEREILVERLRRQNPGMAERLDAMRRRQHAKKSAEIEDELEETKKLLASLERQQAEETKMKERRNRMRGRE